MSDENSLKETGRCAAESIVEMVAALECDYNRYTELRDSDMDDLSQEEKDELQELADSAGECNSREEAEQRIQEDALSVEVRSEWHAPGDANGVQDAEFMILLSTGGPASRIRGELSNGEPDRAWLEVQDWGTPWTRYFDIEQDTLLAYARCFYFGE
jgi:hypothetical protein